MTRAAAQSSPQFNARKVRVHRNHLIEVDTSDSLNLLTNHGVYEPEEIGLCQQLINCGDRVLDIGANIGYYTLLFSDLVSPGGCVTAIEPDQDNFFYLQRNLADQVADKNVFLHQVALGASAHKAQLFRAAGNAGMHRLYSSVCCGSDSVEIAVLKGDNLALAPLEFIKIDIEGYEPAALRGLAITLEQSPNLKILCEFSPLSLWEAGFSPIVFLEEMRAYGLQLLLRHDQKWQVGSFDEMAQTLKKIPEAAIAPFIAKLQNVANNEAVHQQAANFLQRYKYPRPVLENILLVAPGAWETVCNTLHINQPPTATATTAIKKKWQCRWASKYDRASFLTLFESAFGHAMPASLWAWKYGHQDKYGVFAHISGKIIAYYGGLPRKFWLNGKVVSAVQICDVMVAPKMRGILTRRGPFIRTADTFLTASTGQHKAHRFAFGFPTDRAARMGEKSGWYARADSFLEVTWPVVTRLPFWFKATPLTEYNDAVLDKLWRAMQTSLSDHLIPGKDAAFFKWRYLDHPCHSYQSYVVTWRGSKKIVGIVTLRDHGSVSGMEIMDLLGPPGGINILWKTAQDVSARAGYTRLFSWMTPAILSFLPGPTNRSEVAGVYLTPEYKQIIDQQQVNCWLMSGDTDFR